MFNRLVSIGFMLLALAPLHYAGCSPEEHEGSQIGTVNLYLDGERIPHGCVSPSEVTYTGDDFHFQVHIYFGPDLAVSEDGLDCDASDFIRVDVWNNRNDLVEGMELPIEIGKTYAVMERSGTQYQTVTGVSGTVVLNRMDLVSQQFDVQFKDVVFKSYDAGDVVLTGSVDGSW